MQPLILVIHILLCIAIVALVLIQHGKGADIGAAFGSGASNTLFGSQGSLSFLFKLTMLLATLFFVTSIILGYIVHRGEGAPTPAATLTAPASSASAPVTLTINKATS